MNAWMRLGVIATAAWELGLVGLLIFQLGTLPFRASDPPIEVYPPTLNKSAVCGAPGCTQEGKYYALFEDLIRDNDQSLQEKGGPARFKGGIELEGSVSLLLLLLMVPLSLWGLFFLVARIFQARSETLQLSKKHRITPGSSIKHIGMKKGLLGLMRIGRALAGILSAWSWIGVLLLALEWVQQSPTSFGVYASMLLLKLLLASLFGLAFYGLGLMVKRLHKKWFGIDNPVFSQRLWL